jgi:hypothetical protein
VDLGDCRLAACLNYEGNRRSAISRVLESPAASACALRELDDLRVL